MYNTNVLHNRDSIELTRLVRVLIIMKSKRNT